MTQRQSRPEVLAPAGSMDALRAAVFGGADAVYLGATRFSARQNAANFSAGETSGGATASLREAVAFCHARDVRVYVTLNTTLYPGELTALAEAVAGIERVMLEL